MAKLVALLSVRNALTHEMQISEADVDPTLVALLDRDPYGELVPSEHLILAAIEAVETLVLAVDRGLVDFGERLVR